MAFFIGAAIVFNVGVYLYLGSTAGLEFTTGYLMELMLGVDNLFVIILIFTSFGIPRKYRFKVSSTASGGVGLPGWRSYWSGSRWWSRSNGCCTSSGPF